MKKGPITITATTLGRAQYNPDYDQREYVEEGDIVAKGDKIGNVGSTGNSTGPHLHFEIRDYGYLIDPLLVLP